MSHYNYTKVCKVIFSLQFRKNTGRIGRRVEKWCPSISKRMSTPIRRPAKKNKVRENQSRGASPAEKESLSRKPCHPTSS